MFGLIKKDILLMKSTISFIYFLPFIAIIFPVLQNPDLGMSIISLGTGFFLSMQVLQTISMDEASEWDKIESSMPITYKESALVKYILAIMLAMISLVGVAIVGYIFVTFKLLPSTDIMFHSLISFIIAILYNSVIIPVAFRYGSSNCKYIMMLTIGLPTLIMMLLKSFNIKISDILSVNFTFVKLISIIISILIFVISLIISIRIKSKFVLVWQKQKM